MNYAIHFYACLDDTVQSNQTSEHIIIKIVKGFNKKTEH